MLRKLLKYDLLPTWRFWRIVAPIFVFSGILFALLRRGLAVMAPERDAALYILIAGMAGMRRRDSLITVGVLFAFCGAAYGANCLLDYNYMFLMAGDGTPYDIAYNLVGGSPVLYPLLVVALFLVYIAAFYGVTALIRRRKKSSATLGA